mgnify:CR=1 FL=1
MQKKEVCITAGKTAGGIVHCFIDSLKKTGKVGETVIKVTDLCIKTTYKGYKTVVTKTDNFFKRIGYGGNLACWESKQKDVFMKLGEKLFNEKKSNQDKSSGNIIKGEEVEGLLEKAKTCENEIQNIKDKIAIQSKKMDDIAIIKRAKKDMENKDARVRKVALRILERVGTKEVIPIISWALSDPDSEVKQRAVEIIARLEEKCMGPQKIKANKRIEQK